MKKTLVFSTVTALLLSGCMGRAPELIEISQVPDHAMQCAELETAVQQCENNIIDRYHKGRNATNGSIGIGVAAWLLFPPMALLMDLSGADYEEMGAFQARRKHLVSLAAEKGCDSVSSYASDEELMLVAEQEHDRLVKEQWLKEQQEKEKKF